LQADVAHWRWSEHRQFASYARHSVALSQGRLATGRSPKGLSLAPAPRCSLALLAVQHAALLLITCRDKATDVLTACTERTAGFHTLFRRARPSLSATLPPHHTSCRFLHATCISSAWSLCGGLSALALPLTVDPYRDVWSKSWRSTPPSPFLLRHAARGAGGGIRMVHSTSATR
jgi:hypothetical protein